MPVRPYGSASSDDLLDQIVQRGHQIRRRRRMIPLGAAALAAVVALVLIGEPSGTESTRVHTIEPANTSTTTTARSAFDSTPDAAAAKPGSPGNGPMRAAAPPKGSSTTLATAPSASTHIAPIASPGQAAPAPGGTGYTYIQVCSQPTAGGFGGPTAPPYCWMPDKLNVHPGWTVTFDGTKAFGGTVTYHTVTSSSSNWNVDARVYSNPSFGPGQFTYTFTTPGTYTFYDRNGGGTGTVNVSQ